MREKDLNKTGIAAVTGRFYRFSEWLGIISAIGLCGMMVLTVTDVTGRYFFNSPVFGTHEIVGMLLVVTGTLGMAICEKDNSHIAVSIVMDKLPLGLKAIFKKLSLVLSLGIYSLITYKMFDLGFQFAAKGRGASSPELGISLAPVALVFALGTGMYALILLVHLLQAFLPNKRS